MTDQAPEGSGTAAAAASPADDAAQPLVSTATPEPAPDVDLDSLPSGAAGAVEAVLMVVEEPVSELILAQALSLPPDQVASLIRNLAAEYDQQGRGFELRQIAGGWRIFSRTDYQQVVEKFIIGGQQARLTQAALETLAVVAYRQPVSRARVSAVRGVNVDGVMRTLVARGLVEERGVDSDSGALLYATTSFFLERLGLSSVDELPALAPYLPEIDLLDEIAEGASL